MSLIFDADNHYYEPADCFTRFMPADQMDEAIRVVEDGDGARVMIGDRPFTFLKEPFSEIHTKPGSLREMLRNMKAGLPIEENDAIEPVQPAYRERGRPARADGRAGRRRDGALPDASRCASSTS